MSLLLKLPSELLAEVLTNLPRSSLASLACAHRSVAAELASARQDWSWRALCRRDWGVAKPTLATEGDASASEAQAAAASSGVVDRSVAASPPSSAMRASPAADLEEEDDGGIELPQPLGGESWRSVYRRHALHFGPAASAYSRVAPLWSSLLAWLDAHANELPPIAQTLAPTFPSEDSASADFAAAQATAQGLQPLPAPLDHTRLLTQLAKAQIVFRTFQRQVRAQLLAEMDAEEEEARSGGDEKRQSKRTRSHAAAVAAAATAGSSSDEDMKAASAQSSAPHSPVRAPASAADMDVEHKSSAVDSAASAAIEPPFNDVTVPVDLQCLLLLHNGQNLVTRRKDLSTGLFGSFSFYNFEAHYRLQPLEVLLAEGLSAVQQRAVAVLSQARRKRAAAKHKRSRATAPGAASSAADTTTAASASGNDAAARAQAVADVSAQLRMLLPIISSPVAPSNDFFLDCATGRVVRQFGDGSLFEAAPSVLDFFSRWVRDLQGGMFACSPRTGINRFPLHSETGSVTTTRGVQIRTSVLFVPEQSFPDASQVAGAQTRFFFAYHVQIVHDGSTQLRAQLVSRHWIIEDETGHVEEVQGDGVVGYTPFISPGCPPFSYESCCPISTPRGRMRGSFRYVVEGSDEEFDAQINPFVFDISKNYC